MDFTTPLSEENMCPMKLQGELWTQRELERKVPFPLLKVTFTMQEGLSHFQI